MTSTIRSFLIAFALVVGGIMVANLLRDTVSSNTPLMFPVWVLVCLIPAYWYGHRIGIVSYAPREILATAGIVVVAVFVAEFWEKVRPLSALTLAALVCLFFVLRRSWSAPNNSRRDRLPRE